MFDLPVGFGILYPYCLDWDSGEVFGPEVGIWFRDRLKRAWEMRAEAGSAAPKIETRRKHRQIVLCNCLDDVYGHVLFKLFGVKPYLEAKLDAGVAVLLPANFGHLVPEGVSEVWTVDLPLRALTGWNAGLQRELAEAVAARDRCWLGWCYPCPNPTVNVSLFAKPSPHPHPPPGRPRIVFCYREDRTWGGSPRTQARNLRKLAKMLLGRYPEASLILTGCTEPMPTIEGYLDFRASRPDAEREQLWIDLWASADLVIGVHGSNLLVPTGLAGGAIDLLPKGRYSNVFQDNLPNGPRPEARAALFGLRTIYGDEALGNVEPVLVSDVVASVLDERERFLALERTAFVFADPGRMESAVEQAIASLETFRHRGGGRPDAPGRIAKEPDGG